MSPGESIPSGHRQATTRSGRHARDAHRPFFASGGRKAWLDHQSFAVPRLNNDLCANLFR